MSVKLKPMLKGKTYTEKFFVQQSAWGYKEISAIPNTPPCRVTVISHGLPAEWPIRIECVSGMGEINSERRRQDKGWYLATKVDANTIELNDVNPACFGAYTGGGYVRFLLPKDLTGHTVRAQIRPDVASSIVLLDLTSGNGRFVLDIANATASFVVTDEDTQAITWESGVIDAELVAPDGSIPPWELSEVSEILAFPEVTR